MDTVCPKCHCSSGNSWEQCDEWCPMDGSPWFDADLKKRYEEYIPQPVEGKTTFTLWAAVRPDGEVVRSSGGFMSPKAEKKWEEIGCKIVYITSTVEIPITPETEAEWRDYRGIPDPKHKYRVVVNNNTHSADDRDKVYEIIGRYPLGSIYSVYDSKGRLVPEFIPF